MEAEISEKRCAELERDIRSYEKAQRYIKGVYLESLEMENPDPSLGQLADTGAYLRGRIFEMESDLLVLKKGETAPE